MFLWQHINDVCGSDKAHEQNDTITIFPLKKKIQHKTEITSNINTMTTAAAKKYVYFHTVAVCVCVWLYEFL